jgi:hypothetical protein
MNLYEFADKIVEAVNRLTKTKQKSIRTNFDAEWRLVCLITSGWITPDGVTAKGRDHLDALARGRRDPVATRRATMPIIEEEDASGEIRRKFVVRTTAERRRDRRVRAALRRWKIGIDPEVYARVWAATAGVSDPEAVALVYQAELARAAVAKAHGHRPEALALAARQIGKAAKALVPANSRPLLALPPAIDEPTAEFNPRGGAG